MRKQLEQVTQFHQQIGEVVADSPRLLQHSEDLDRNLANSLREVLSAYDREDEPRTQLMRRAMMAIEELAEWVEAHNERDLVAAADAWADRITVLLGDAVATGMPAERLLDEVHRSNMTKLAVNEQTGKGTKSECYQRPEIEQVLNHVDRGEN
ncbi:Phosphoribosyl-ATP pyrophosphohydrolase [Novipirellula aureliae]|uniref:Phosphoribosyl-ATP pyrophosphohydrolase n=1 Tax=Novipirellula aureliae TaxID=2527966 RepID=A0A5C6DT60_9BACT|nr:nucleoside triphosphate pyrophosphohydrolase family protein [Novipirellula aureliae]TWU38691.1 Phosphoribosyl-ATP pyrophosphohydrolase [Novipirellula aureliae]